MNKNESGKKESVDIKMAIMLELASAPNGVFWKRSIRFMCRKKEHGYADNALKIIKRTVRAHIRFCMKEQNEYLDGDLEKITQVIFDDLRLFLPLEPSRVFDCIDVLISSHDNRPAISAPQKHLG